MPKDVTWLTEPVGTDILPKTPAALPPIPNDTVPLPKKLNLEKKPQKPEPIKLKYTYTGTCPDCMSRVETLEIELDKRTHKVHAVAFCNGCKKQLEVREVSKL